MDWGMFLVTASGLWVVGGRLQPGTVSFNAIAAGYGRFSQWHRSLEAAGQLEISRSDGMLRSGSDMFRIVQTCSDRHRYQTYQDIPRHTKTIHDLPRSLPFWRWKVSRLMELLLEPSSEPRRKGVSVGAIQNRTWETAGERWTDMDRLEMTRTQRMNDTH